MDVSESVDAMSVALRQFSRESRYLVTHSSGLDEEVKDVTNRFLLSPSNDEC
jgi:hypothetical protein